MEDSPVSPILLKFPHFNSEILSCQRQTLDFFFSIIVSTCVFLKFLCSLGLSQTLPPPETLKFRDAWRDFPPHFSPRNHWGIWPLSSKFHAGPWTMKYIVLPSRVLTSEPGDNRCFPWVKANFLPQTLFNTHRQRWEQTKGMEARWVGLSPPLLLLVALHSESPEDRAGPRPQGTLCNSEISVCLMLLLITWRSWQATHNGTLHRKRKGQELGFPTLYGKKWKTTPSIYVQIIFNRSKVF